MDMTLDKFRFETWITPEPYVQYLTRKIYHTCAAKHGESWFWENPGHLYCFIHLSLFGHMFPQKYRYLVEAYHRCDLRGIIAAQSGLTSQLNKLEFGDDDPWPRCLIVALILCGVERAGPNDPGPVKNRENLVSTILGELQVGQTKRDKLSQELIKSARTDVRAEKDRFQQYVRQHLSMASGLGRLSPDASLLFPSTFEEADRLAREALENAPSPDLCTNLAGHEIWQRIVAGPHPLPVLEVSWILVHFRLREVHASHGLPVTMRQVSAT